MKINRFLKEGLSCVVFDAQFKVVDVYSQNSKLFFGVHFVLGKTFEEQMLLGGVNLHQISVLKEKLSRAIIDKNSFEIEYESYYGNGASSNVMAYAECMADGTLRLFATDKCEDDALNDAEISAASRELKHALSEVISENLPVGLEIYDKNGILIEVNPMQLKIMGIADKNDILGLDIFENPNVNEDVRERMRAGANFTFTTQYDFDLANKFYCNTFGKGVRYLDIIVSTIKDGRGDIDKYILIVQDVTDNQKLQRRYEELYNQTITTLDSLPVGVVIYAKNGKAVYFNDKLCNIFGLNKGDVRSNPVNVNLNPIVPVQVKNAIRDALPYNERIEIDFDAVNRFRSYQTSFGGMRQFECKGRPIINGKGRIDDYVFIIEDVTENAIKEAALKQSKRKIEVAVSASDITLWEFDVKSRMFTSDNEPLNGYDQSVRLSISDYMEAVHPDDVEGALKLLDIMCKGKDAQFHYDVRLMMPGKNEWQYCSINCSPFERDGNGNIISYAGSRKNNSDLQKKKLLQDKILDSIPLPIIIKSPDPDVPYIFCNQESKRMFGISEDITLHDVSDINEVIRIEKTDKEVFSTGKPYLGVERIILKDGRSYDMIVRKSIFEDDGKRMLLSVRWDQSLQNDLQRRAKVLSISMESMNAYTWFFEPAKGLVNYGEGFDKLGKKAEEVDTLDKFIGAIHPEDRGKFRSALEELLAGDSGLCDIEYRIDLNGDNVYYWWRTRGLLDTSIINDAPYKYMMGMSINIDMHKQTELTLLRNREELKQLIKQKELVLNNTNSGLAYITKDYVVQWENVSTCSKSISYKAFEKGELCFRSTHKLSSPCKDCVMQRAMASRQVEQIKFCLNNERVVEVFASPVIGDNDIVEGVVIRLDDITEREKMIEELRKAKSVAEQSDKLKSAFLANMSHEIRTPLNAIVGFSDLLANTEDLQDRAEYMQIINSNNDLLLKLISDILDLSKIEAGSIDLKYDKFDLSQYFNAMVSSMSHRVTNSDVRLIANNRHDVCWVVMDCNRVAQILTNYISNSIKYTSKGYIEAGYDVLDNGVRLWVKDTGIGIEKDKCNKVFHRFAKLDEFAQGTGLGLSICKAIAEAMGGSVGFESVAAEGSLFWAILPCEVEVVSVGVKSQSEIDIEVVVDDSKQQEDSGRKTILIAEDITSNYLLLSALLRKNYNLIRAENGRIAVEIAKNKGVDLLLMDMKMPVMNGLEATAEIRKFNTDLPILALTAHAFDSDRQAAIDAGCNDYLVKPIDKKLLISKLEEYGCPGLPLI